MTRGCLTDSAYLSCSIGKAGPCQGRSRFIHLLLETRCVSGRTDARSHASQRYSQYRAGASTLHSHSMVSEPRRSTQLLQFVRELHESTVSVSVGTRRLVAQPADRTR